MSVEESQRKDFHEWRRSGITGTDAPKLFGADGAFGDSTDVFLEKKSLSPPPEETSLMRRGKLLEPLFAAEYERETGNKVRRQPRKIHPNRDWMRCHVDRQILRNEKQYTTSLEIKTLSRSKMAKVLLYGLTEATIVQSLHNAEVWGYLKPEVFIGCADTWQFKRYVIDTTDLFDILNQLIDLEDAFWHINILGNAFPEREEKAVDLPDPQGDVFIMNDVDEFIMAAKHLFDAEQILADAKAYVDGIHDKIQSLMKDNNTEVAEAGFYVDNMMRTIRYYFRQNRPGRKTVQGKTAVNMLTAIHNNLEKALKEGDPELLRLVVDDFVKTFDADMLYKVGKEWDYKRHFFLSPKGE